MKSAFEICQMTGKREREREMNGLDEEEDSAAEEREACTQTAAPSVPHTLRPGSNVLIREREGKRNALITAD